MSDSDHKVAIITGGSQGIGAGLVGFLAKVGKTFELQASGRV